MLGQKQCKDFKISSFNILVWIGYLVIYDVIDIYVYLYACMYACNILL